MAHFKSIASVAFGASAFLAIQLVPYEAAAAQSRHSKSHHARKPVKKPAVRHYAAPRRQPVYVPQQSFAPAPQQTVVSPFSPYGWLITVNAKTYVTPRYVGADRYAFIAFPTLSFRRPGEPPR